LIYKSIRNIFIIIFRSTASRPDGRFKRLTFGCFLKIGQIPKIIRGVRLMLYFLQKNPSLGIVEYSGADYTTCPVTGNHYSVLKGTDIPVSETV
jgi:hypothetical protein